MAEQPYKYCPSCGEKALANAAFCGKCGTAFPAKKYCPSCGEKALANAAFCGKCGTAFPAKSKPARKTAPRKFPKITKKMIFNIALLAACAALVVLGIIYIPDKVHDAMLPEVTVETNYVSDEVREMYRQVSDTYHTTDRPDPYEEGSDAPEDEEEESIEDEMLLLHLWYGPEAEAVEAAGEIEAAEQIEEPGEGGNG